MKQRIMFLSLALIASISLKAYDIGYKELVYNITNQQTHEVEVTYVEQENGEYYTGDITIPDKFLWNGIVYKVTSIGNWAFNGCSELTSITIPNSVTSIGDWAFSDCSALTSITIPNGVTSLGEWSFGGCRGLKSIILPNSLTSIGLYALDGCTGLTSLTIPSSVTYIGFFGNNDGLMKIVVDENNPVYDSRNNCNAIIETATNTLVKGCRGTTIPHDVTTIGYGAFWGNWSMPSIVLPSSIKSISPDAFAWCISLHSVMSQTTTPCEFVENAFWEIPSDCALLIPNGTLDAYIAAGWTEDVFKGGIYYYNTLVDDDMETNDVSNYVLLQGKDGREEVPVSIVTDPVNASNHCIGIQSLDNPNNHWDTQFFVKSSRELGKGNRFKLRMKVRAEKDAIGVLEAHRTPGDHAFWITDFDYTTNWIEHTWDCTVSADGVMSFAMSENDLPESIMYYFDDIELIEYYPANQSSALDGMLALMNSTNVYTKEAYDAYKAQYDYYKEKNKAGELTESVVNPYKVAGWRSANGFDDFLLSVWTIGGQKCKDYDTPLYINTWSTEADGKVNSSGMHVPFYEYWTENPNSLEANSLEAIVTDLEDGTYTVEALVRVRMKDGAEAPAYGITMSVNGGTAVDVCAGNECGDNAGSDLGQFRYDTFTAMGIVTDGTLRIVFDVAADNNVNWLSFKNVKYKQLVEDNAIYADDVTGFVGSKITLPIMMDNKEDIIGLQFDLTLPEGVSVVTDEDDEYLFTLTDRATTSHRVTADKMSDGSYRVLVSSLKNSKFKGNEGAIIEATLAIAEDMAAGEYPVKIANIEMSTGQITAIRPYAFVSKLTIQDSMPGDANGDGTVSVTDVTMTISHILGQTPAGFNKDAVDINRDGSISVTDVTLIIDMILKQK